MLRPVLALLRNTKPTRLFLVPFLLIGISCARFPAELAPHGADKSIIAIKVKQRGFHAFLHRWSRQRGGSPVIFFVRLQADGQNRQGDLLISNHRVGGYAYVFNASPGRYAAIGFGRTGPTSDPWIEHDQWMAHWYFPESMIDETTVTVEPSGVAFMGEFEVSGDLQFDDADDTQKHYSSFFWGPPQKGNWWEMSSRFVAEYRKAQSEIATERFIESSRGLAELGWRVLNGD
jgi:hypothetical protein